MNFEPRTGKLPNWLIANCEFVHLELEITVGHAAGYDH